jgi:hypothetical protein
MPILALACHLASTAYCKPRPFHVTEVIASQSMSGKISTSNQRIPREAQIRNGLGFAVVNMQITWPLSQAVNQNMLRFHTPQCTTAMKSWYANFPQLLSY